MKEVKNAKCKIRAPLEVSAFIYIYIYILIDLMRPKILDFDVKLY